MVVYLKIDKGEEVVLQYVLFLMLSCVSIFYFCYPIGSYYIISHLSFELFDIST